MHRLARHWVHNLVCSRLHTLVQIWIVRPTQCFPTTLAAHTRPCVSSSEQYYGADLNTTSGPKILVGLSLSK